jgi:hypothetical protein
MRRSAAITGFVLLLIIPCAVAGTRDNPTVNFFIGSVTLEANGTTAPVKVGQELPLNGILRTGEGAIVEIRTGMISFTVKEKQSVQCSVISSLGKGSAGEDPVLLKLMKNYRKRSLFATLAAVRADEKNETEVVWDSDGKPAAVSDRQAFESINEASLQGDFSTAVLFYEKYMEYGGVPGEKTTYAAAVAYQQLCQYRKSLEMYESIIKSSKSPSLVINSTFSAGVSAFGLPDYDKTVELMSAYLDKEPHGTLAPQALYLRGMSYKMNSEMGKANEDFNRLISLFRDDPLAQSIVTEMSSKSGMK